MTNIRFDDILETIFGFRIGKEKRKQESKIYGKLNLKQISSLTLTLFAIFFGAGNMIFPPAMGQLAGENYLQALAGFILTDAGIALLGIVAVVFTWK